MFCYCRRCGRIVDEDTGGDFKCDRCRYELRVVPEEYIEDEVFLKDEEQFIEEYIKSAPEFDQALFDTFDEWNAKRFKEWDDIFTEQKARESAKSNQLTCPYCKSTRVSRIGLLSRIVSVEFWGLASSKIGKQWHCDNCGSEF